MGIQSKKITFSTEGEVQMIDITGQVGSAVSESGLKSGIACIFTPGSTCAVTTTEYEPGLLLDIPAALERIAPKDIEYRHDEKWGDGNGHSHVRSALLGPSITVPFEGGRLSLGQWQQIVFVELDVKPRQREVIVKLIPG
jgi:secondary thiamine-phosphate synthase enzyme